MAEANHDWPSIHYQMLRQGCSMTSNDGNGINKLKPSEQWFLKINRAYCSNDKKCL